MNTAYAVLAAVPAAWFIYYADVSFPGALLCGAAMWVCNYILAGQMVKIGRDIRRALKRRGIRGCVEWLFGYAEEIEELE